MKDQEIVPLRVVLRNFLNHIENLESQSCPEKSYEAEFQDLKIFSENVKSLKEYSTLEGEKEVNRKKNRYKDILPFDVSRVVLNEYAGIPGSDYINANYIKGASGSLAYIASQGPLPSTVNDFWRMVVQCEVQVIVMACNEEEAGKAKCEKYWVDDGEEKKFGMISVKLLKSSTVCSDFSVRTMRLKYTNSDSVVEERTVCQLHYVAWPDHGVPTVVQPLLDMVRLVRDTQASETLPVLVHCSAGCGRTGTICAIDYVWGLLRTGKLTNDFSLLSLIRDMRKQRIAMVQTKEQYVLVHQAVRELFKEQLSMIDSHPYENVDTNGLLIIKEEENTYDSIDYQSTNSLEEKRDNKEKDSVPPPLPSKRNITKFPSKYEKEIENLTAQQKAMKLNRSLFPVYPSNEKKKPNNKEFYNGFDKMNKRTTESQVKSTINKPIPSKGILSVPQLESAPKCKTNVKRSKSLKIVRNCEKNTLSFCQNSPAESKRRSSLESNFDEHAIETEICDQLKSKLDNEPPIEPKKKSVSQLVSKYDIIKNQDHRTFVRSLTCLDLRPKMVFSHTNSVVSSLEDSLAKQRVKLLRSNTQINVLKKNNPYSASKNGNVPPPMVDSMSGMKVDNHHNNYSFLGSKKINPTYDKLGNGNLRFGPKPSGNDASPAFQKSLYQKSSGSKDLFLKSTERVKNPTYQRFEGLRYMKDPSKPRSSSTNRSEQIKGFEESCESYPVDRSLKPSLRADKFSLSSMKVVHSNSSPDHNPPPRSVEEPTYGSRTNHYKFLKSSKALPANKPSPSMLPPKDKSPNVQSPSKDLYGQSRQFREDFSRLQHFNPHVQEEYTSISNLKSSPSFKECYSMEDSNSSEQSTSSWHERDISRMQATYGKSLYSTNYAINRSKGQSLLINTPDDSKDVQRRLEGDTMLENYERLKSPIYQEGNSLQHGDIDYHLQNRKNIHQYNGSIHTSRHTTVPNIGADVPSSIIHRNAPMLQPKLTDVPSGSQDASYYSPGPEIHRNYQSSCFHSAPGVDLDQVAASISKNDQSLMKATLEELQVRQTRLLMTPKDRCPPKGVPNSGSGSDKKKQQQYL